MPGLTPLAQAELAVELAHTLLGASQSLATRHERALAGRLGALMEDPSGQAFATAITDRVHRSKSGAQLVRQVRALLAEFGIPTSLPRLDRLELRALASFGSSLPELTAAAVRQRIYHDASPYIVPADADVLAKYLQEMAGDQVRVNVNHLGEEVLGEREAERHWLAYADLLERPEVSTISVKISSLYSQLRPVAFEHTVRVLSERLYKIYDKARQARPHKLVYLDMESYRDLAMTVELFTRVLDEPRFADLTAGIVLQAYLPDSVHFQTRLTAWARARHSEGKAPIRVRIVKGANLAMERLEASQRGWPLATYESKHEVDANYKRLLLFACRPEHARAVHLGVASHNVFDLAYALVVRRSQGVESLVELEMLEGMAQPLRRVLQQVAGSVLVYAPSVDEKNFPAAVAYLVRRLDENTGEDNFLRHSFGMRPGDARFKEQARAFVAACEARASISSASKRNTERRALELSLARPAFDNEPDTDFTNDANRAWLSECLKAAEQAQFEIPLEVSGAAWRDGQVCSGVDPSRPGVEAYRYVLANDEVLERVLTGAEQAAASWARTPTSERARLISNVAQELRAARGELIAHMLLDAGKRVEEADAEVSEAVDFAEYYARQFVRLDEAFETRPKGVVLVTPPWNFPLAIPLGGVVASLVAGNVVILKPAPESILVAATLVRICHRAGIPKPALQFVVCGDELGSRLIADRRVALVVLTGGTQTAHLFHRLRPGLDLIAETGGKNAIYVSDVCDQEQAVRHVVHSAFSHSGQKCSACSLLIVHRDLYREESFKSQLLDATESLPVGSAWHLENFVTPLIRPPEGALRQGIDTLEAGEEWLLAPRRHADNPHLLAPGIKWNVRPGGLSHMTEFFGPLLSVMPAGDLDQALELINCTPYGLTSGIQSLDPSQCRAFADSVDAGNVYINHPVTGAIVGRQPFGGRKASGFGPGAKAGGPNYVAQFCVVEGRRSRLKAPALSRGPRHAQSSSLRIVPGEASGLAEVRRAGAQLSEEDREQLEARFHNYSKVFDQEFSRAHPQADVLGQHNVLRYQPCRVLLLLGVGSHLLDVLSCLLAARMARAVLTLLASPQFAISPLSRGLPFEVERYESQSVLGELLKRRSIERLRCVGPSTRELEELPSRHAVFVDAGPAHDDGYVELRRYLKEQSVCTSTHRYGNLKQPRGTPRSGLD